MFGRPKLVVKQYRGSLSINLLTFPVKAPIALLTLGRKAHLTEDVNQVFEKDAKRMLKKGYRVQSVNNGGALHGRDLTVTYQLVEPEKQAKD